MDKYFNNQTNLLYDLIKDCKNEQMIKRSIIHMLKEVERDTRQKATHLVYDLVNSIQNMHRTEE